MKMDDKLEKIWNEQATYFLRYHPSTGMQELRKTKKNPQFGWLEFQLRFKPSTDQI
jgi:hypothetical protein